MKNPNSFNSKGGNGSGPPPRGSHQAKPHGGPTPKPMPSGAPSKPSNYNEKPSSVNPGKPRAGIAERDLYPERFNPDGTRKPSKR